MELSAASCYLSEIIKDKDQDGQRSRHRLGLLSLSHACQSLLVLEIVIMQPLNEYESLSFFLQEK